MTFYLFYSNLYTPAIMYNVAFRDGLDNTVAARAVPNTSHFHLFSLTLLTNNLFTAEECTELTSHRTNLEGFWIALSDGKSILKQMSYLKQCLKLRCRSSHDV